LQITVTGQQIDVGDSLHPHIEHASNASIEKNFFDATVLLAGDSFRNSKHVSPGLACRCNDGNIGWVYTPETEA
jgi:hypothetical protein